MAKVSLRKSINAMCKSCIYDPQSGNGAWRQQVENCTALSCPLYGARPRSTAKEAPTHRVTGENGTLRENWGEKVRKSSVNYYALEGAA